MTSDAASRIEALEIALSHAEAAIEDLSATARAQWDEIDNLKRDVIRLSRRLEAAMEADEGDTPAADSPPPHY
ncbi:MAG: SlyX family protein [Pseudomonadota bacterium]